MGAERDRHSIGRKGMAHMKYVNHMTCAFQDEKVQAAVAAGGIKVYAAYWIIVEAISAQIRPESISVKMTLTWQQWGARLLTDVRTVRRIASILQVAALIVLQDSGKSATIEIPNILKYADEYTKRVCQKSGQTPGLTRDKLGTLSGSPALPALPALPDKQDLTPIAPTPAKGNGAGSKPKAWANLISWNRDKGCFEGITPEIIEKWEKAYPALDLNSQLNRADEWLKANPTKQKSNYYRFVINWLSRAQEGGGR